MRLRIVTALAAALWASPLLPADSPVLESTVMLVNAEEPAAVEALRVALASTEAPVRVAASRVALVRGFAGLSGDLRTALLKESDAVAAREEIRALAILETKIDADFLMQQAARFPAGIDASLALAVARRGPEAVDFFLQNSGASLAAF